jgi:membrane associated rhomboid family serine protease
MPLPVGTDRKLESFPWVTASIILVCFFNYFFDFGTGEWIIPLPFFMHADFGHLFFNMIFLWVFGSYLEDRVGAVRFLLFYVVCELGTEFLAYGVFGQEGIGASGAISGIQGIYLVRFFQSKVRTIIPVGPVFWRIDFPAKAIIAFWFARDLVFALSQDASPIGHWAHVGGFLTGMIIGKAYRYDVKGRVEHLLDRAGEAVREGRKSQDVEAALVKALDADPDNPELNLHLARLYARQEARVVTTRHHFREAVRKFYTRRGDPEGAALAFLEMVRACGDEPDVSEYLKFSAMLAGVGKFSGAADILKRLLEQSGLSGPDGEKALVNLVHYAAEAGDTDLAQRAVHRLEELYPETGRLDQARNWILTAERSQKLVLPASREQRVRAGPRFWTWLDETTSEPLFWLTWSLGFPIMYYVGLMGLNLLGGGLFTFLFIVLFPTVTALAVAHVYRNSGEWAASFIFGTGRRRSEQEARRDFNISHYFNLGRAAERDEKHLQAVQYYRAVLEEDPKHVEARFRLAGIYLRNLDRRGSAIHEYENLLESAPAGSAYVRETRVTLEALRAGRPIGPAKIEPLKFEQGKRDSGEF